MPGLLSRNDNGKDSAPFFFCNLAYDPYSPFDPHHILINNARNAQPSL
jgi:hypothetical protein